MIGLLKEILRHFIPYRAARFARQTAKRIAPSVFGNRNEAEMLRNRTDQELDLQARGLVEVCDVMNGLSIPYYIIGGALLGAVRDGDFIKWDFDVDIETKTELVRPKQDLLLSALRRAGFEIHTHNPSITDFKIIAVKYGVQYEIAGYLKMGSNRYRRRSFHPDYPDGGEIVIRRQKYHTFQEPENYLNWFYGDWKTPVRAVNDYFPTNSRTSPWALTLIELVSLYRSTFKKK